MSMFSFISRKKLQVLLLYKMCKVIKNFCVKFQRAKLYSYKTPNKLYFKISFKSYSVQFTMKMLPIEINYNY